MNPQNIIATLYDMAFLKEEAFENASKSTFFLTAMIVVFVGLVSALFSFVESVLFSLLLPQFFGEFNQALFLIQAFMLVISIPVTIIVLGIALLITAFITWGVARLLGGVANFESHINGLSYFLLFTLLISIPLLGWIILLPIIVWAFVMQVFFVKKIHSISTMPAVISVLAPLIIVLIFALIVGLIATIIILAF